MPFIIHADTSKQRALQGLTSGFTTGMQLGMQSAKSKSELAFLEKKSRLADIEIQQAEIKLGRMGGGKKTAAGGPLKHVGHDSLVSLFAREGIENARGLTASPFEGVYDDDVIAAERDRVTAAMQAGFFDADGNPLTGEKRAAAVENLFGGYLDVIQTRHLQAFNERMNDPWYTPDARFESGMFDALPQDAKQAYADVYRSVKSTVLADPSTLMAQMDRLEAAEDELHLAHSRAKQMVRWRDNIQKDDGGHLGLLGKIQALAEEEKKGGMAGMSYIDDAGIERTRYQEGTANNLLSRYHRWNQSKSDKASHEFTQDLYFDMLAKSEGVEESGRRRERAIRDESYAVERKRYQQSIEFQRDGDFRKDVEGVVRDMISRQIHQDGKPDLVGLSQSLEEQGIHLHPEHLMSLVGGMEGDAGQEDRPAVAGTGLDSATETEGEAPDQSFVKDESGKILLGKEAKEAGEPKPKGDTVRADLFAEMAGKTAQQKGETMGEWYERSPESFKGDDFLSKPGILTGDPRGYEDYGAALKDAPRTLNDKGKDLRSKIEPTYWRSIDEGMSEKEIDENLDRILIQAGVDPKKLSKKVRDQLKASPPARQAYNRGFVWSKEALKEGGELENMLIGELWEEQGIGRKEARPLAREFIKKHRAGLKQGIARFYRRNHQGVRGEITANIREGWGSFGLRNEEWRGLLEEVHKGYEEGTVNTFGPGEARSTPDEWAEFYRVQAEGDPTDEKKGKGWSDTMDELDEVAAAVEEKERLELERLHEDATRRIEESRRRMYESMRLKVKEAKAAGVHERAVKEAEAEKAVERLARYREAEAKVMPDIQRLETRIETARRERLELVARYRRLTDRRPSTYTAVRRTAIFEVKEEMDQLKRQMEGWSQEIQDKHDWLEQISTGAIDAD